MSRLEPREPIEGILRVHPAERGCHRVSAEVLVRALVGVQQTVFLLAAAAEKQVIRERFRPSEELRERAMLLCDVPAKGSFALPMRLADEQMSLLSAGRQMGLLEVVYELFNAMARGTKDSIVELLPDSAIRVRTMKELQKISPQRGERWAIGFSAFQKEETILDEQASRCIEEWIVEDTAPEDTVMTVTGELIRVFFEERKITIRYKPANRAIDCYFRSDVVDEILEDRQSHLRSTGRFDVQVTGQFLLDKEGHPRKLTNVYRVTAVDTSPMTFERIRHGDRVFALNPPLRLDVRLDEESGQLYVASEETLGIHAYAQTREQLVDEIAEQLAFNWDEYVEEDPTRLAKGALKIREAMQARVGMHNG